MRTDDDAPSLPPNILAAIRYVVDYLADDERRDYDARTRPEKKNHIYRPLRVLKLWLAQVRDKPIQKLDKSC